MRTRRSWLGVARRWAVSPSQYEVEDPTTVLLLGRDEPDGAELWIGSASSGALITVAIAALVDLFVLAVRMSGTGAPVTALIDATPVAPAVVVGAFVRSPPAATPNAFFHNLGALPGGTNICQGSAAAVAWEFLPEPGLLLPAGSSLECSTGVAGNTLGVMWRGA